MSIIDKIAKIKNLNYVPSDHISISLIPPSVLILQLIEATMANVGNITQIFQQMQFKIDYISFLKQYIPFIDWELLEKQGIIKQLEDKISKDLGGGEEEMDGMGGMY